MFSKQFNKASRYESHKEKSRIDLYTPLATGLLFLIIGINYLSFAIKALGRGESFYFMVSLAIFAAFVASFVMLRRGIAMEKIYNNSKFTKAPQYPLKTIAGVLLSLVSSFSAYLGGYSLFSSLMLGSAILLGWYLYYGFDPRDDKIEGYDSRKSAERIMKLLVQANADVEVINKSADQTVSLSLQTLMHETAAAFEKIIKHIEEEPDDYERARKYLVSYLGEIRSMSETYIKLESMGRSEEMKMAFQQTLQSSIEKLGKQYERLMDEDMVDLDVKLSVMKKRLESEE